ncbi:MAG TPA: Sec-independent protein translocase subunit TatA [Actinocrinis sp.]|nr:Sec-independent protein translocase subunit TatA [Actinocrinis sp.]
MLRAFEPWHLVIIGGIATLLFGAKRLPDSARSIGQSLRILKSEVAADQADKPAAADPAAQPAPAVLAAPVAAPVAAPAPAAAPAAAATQVPTPAAEHAEAARTQ